LEKTETFRIYFCSRADVILGFFAPSGSVPACPTILFDGGYSKSLDVVGTAVPQIPSRINPSRPVYLDPYRLAFRVAMDKGWEEKNYLRR
jgi:hypothetical protein